MVMEGGKHGIYLLCHLGLHFFLNKFFLISRYFPWLARTLPRSMKNNMITFLGWESFLPFTTGKFLLCFFPPAPPPLATDFLPGFPQRANCTQQVALSVWVWPWVLPLQMLKLNADITASHSWSNVGSKSSCYCIFFIKEAMQKQNNLIPFSILSLFISAIPFLLAKQTITRL